MNPTYNDAGWVKMEKDTCYPFFFFLEVQFGNNPLVWAILFLLAPVFHCGVRARLPDNHHEYVAQIMLQVDQ